MKLLTRILAFLVAFWLGIMLVDEIRIREFEAIIENPLEIMVYAHNKIVVNLKRGGSRVEFCNETEAVKEILKHMNPSNGNKAVTAILFDQSFRWKNEMNKVEIDSVINEMKIRLCNSSVEQIYAVEPKCIGGGIYTRMDCSN